MAFPLISIIVPIYKVEPYLRQCVDSIVNQTYTNLEIILVDDGSPDTCSQICDEYAAKDNRITVIHKENGGLSDARNVGLDKSNGDYVSFVDSDDWIELDYISTLFSLIEANHADIAVGNFQRFSLNNDYFPKEHLATETLTSDEILEKILFQRNSYTIAWGKLFKKSLFNSIRFPVGKIHEDEYTGYKPYCYAKTISCTSKILYHYLIRNDSITGQEVFQDKSDILEDEAIFFHQHGYFYFAHFLFHSLCIEWLKRCRLSKKDKNFMFSHEFCIKKFKVNVHLMHKNPHKISFSTIILYLVAKVPKLYFLYRKLTPFLHNNVEELGLVKIKK